MTAIKPLQTKTSAYFALNCLAALTSAALIALATAMHSAAITPVTLTKMALFGASLGMSSSFAIIVVACFAVLAAALLLPGIIYCIWGSNRNHAPVPVSAVSAHPTESGWIARWRRQPLSPPLNVTPPAVHHHPSQYRHTPARAEPDGTHHHYHLRPYP